LTYRLCDIPVISGGFNAPVKRARTRGEAVTQVHHFAYGSINPVLAFVLSFLGSLLSLVLAARARGTTGWDRARWLLFSALALGGTGIWLMHFMAMLGFDVPQTLITYDLWITAASFVLAVLMVSVGLFVSVFSSPSGVKIAIGGIFTGIGVASMHYTGMSALDFAGEMTFDPTLVGASFIIAVVAATVALWFAAVIRGATATVAAAALMAVAVCSMHYTGMAAVQIELDPGRPPAEGMGAFELLAPIAVLACVMISTLAYATVGFTVRRENAQEEALLERARELYEAAAMVPAETGRHK
jgi:NO-binding membrane sensor protein with MHYT domain